MRDLPVKTKPEDLSRIIDLLYGDTAAYQWVREWYINAVPEAGATRIRFGIEWQSVEARGVYPRYIADNGAGMYADDLLRFFSHFGESGKVVGSRFDNYGIGAKLCSMPWNPNGVAICSWKDGEAAMIVIRKTDGIYALQTWMAENEDGDDEMVNVIVPGPDPELGIDWSQVGPDWVREEGGTVVVLLGSDENPDTILGDINRDEHGQKGINLYLNTRLHEIPEGVEISVESFTKDQWGWPKSLAEAQASVGSSDRLWQDNRYVSGMKHFLDGAELSGVTEPLDDGSRIHWFVYDQPVKTVSDTNPPRRMVGLLYRNEIYSVESHFSKLHSFGVIESSVSNRTAILVEIPDTNVIGTTSNRSQLTYDLTGEIVSYEPWADYFAANLPTEIAELLAQAISTYEGSDEDVKEELVGRYGERLRMIFLMLTGKGKQTTTPYRRKAVTGRRRGPKVNEGTHPQGGGSSEAEPNIGTGLGVQKAKTVGGARGDIPHTQISNDEAPEMPFLYDPRSRMLTLFKNHLVVKTQVAYWQSQYRRGTEPLVEKELLAWYCREGAMKVAHTDQLASILTQDQIGTMLSPEGLMMGLLGMIQDDAVLRPLLGGKLPGQAVARRK